jgi:hypothetical protein
MLLTSNYAISFLEKSPFYILIFSLFLEVQIKNEEIRHKIKSIRKELQEDAKLANATLNEKVEYIGGKKIKIVSNGSYVEKMKARTSASIILINEKKSSGKTYD